MRHALSVVQHLWQRVFFCADALLIGKVHGRSYAPAPSQWSKSRMTSYLFITNAIHLWRRRKFCYAMVSVLLTYTCLRLRRHFPCRTFDLNIDYLVVAIFIAHGAWQWLRIAVTDVDPRYQLVVVSTFVFCTLLHEVRRKKLVYEPLVDVYEAIIHMVASTGHHLVAWKIV